MTGGINRKQRPAARHNSTRQTTAIAIDRFTRRRSSMPTAWSSATAIMIDAPINVRETTACRTASTSPTTSSTPKQTVKTVFSVTWEGRSSRLGCSTSLAFLTTVLGPRECRHRRGAVAGLRKPVGKMGRPAGGLFGLRPFQVCAGLVQPPQLQVGAPQ